MAASEADPIDTAGSAAANDSAAIGSAVIGSAVDAEADGVGVGSAAPVERIAEGVATAEEAATLGATSTAAVAVGNGDSTGTQGAGRTSTSVTAVSAPADSASEATGQEIGTATAIARTHATPRPRACERRLNPLPPSRLQLTDSSADQSVDLPAG